MLNPSRCLADLIAVTATTILDFVAPAVCMGCGGKAPPESPLACPQCLTPPTGYPLLHTLDSTTHRRAENDPTEGQSATLEVCSIYPYAGSVGALIRAMKYQQLDALAIALGKQAGSILQDSQWTGSNFSIADLHLVPIPLHRTRYRERGFNQSLRIAQGIAAVTATAPPQEELRRRRRTGTQTRLSRRERHINLDHAFEALGDLSGSRVCLVDDVVTTGATLLAAAAALRHAGAQEVRAVTIAWSTPKRDQNWK